MENRTSDAETLESSRNCIIISRQLVQASRALITESQKTIGATTKTISASVELLDANRRVIENHPYYRQAVELFQLPPQRELRNCPSPADEGSF